MSVAPENVRLRKAIRKIVEANTLPGAEKIMFLGREGELREVGYPSDSTASLQATRERMIADGALGAIVHMCIAKADSHGYYTLVEVFDDPAQPTRHAMTSWAQLPHWVEVPEELREEGDATGDT